MSSIMSSKNDYQRQKETLTMPNNPAFAGVFDHSALDSVTDTASATHAKQAIDLKIKNKTDTFILPLTVPT